jgi:N-acetylgalactosamine kinase
MSLPDGWDDEELARATKLVHRVRGNASIVAVRAPGRVNLIGEHTDYSGLPVLPVAIDRSTIVVAAANATGEIEVSNADPVWQSRLFAIERKIPPYATGDWANYVKAAIQGVIDHFSARTNWRGASIVVDGRVPAAAGLSSSSALTVSTAMAFMAVNQLELDPLETATMVARSERYVGTHGGGMDQAVSILGRRDHALFVEFDPLRVRAIKMPANAALVVADSRQIADKSGTVRAEYNRRVVECSLAARILGHVLELNGVTILGDIVRALPQWNAANLVEKLAALPARLGADLKEAASILDVTQLELDAELLGQGSNRIALDSSRPLEVLKRARHVLSETERVIRAAGALEAGRLDEMGTLMNASHASLADDFECSTARLDAIVECARRGGALGARLTGAGFGGSIVALCDVSGADAVIESIDRGYYVKQHPGESPENWRSVLHAGAGASVIDLSANA